MKIKTSFHKSAKLAWSIVGLGVILSGVGIFFAFQYRSILIADTYVTWQSRIIQLIPVFFTFLVGGMIVARLPDNRAGWAMLGSIFANTIQTFVESLGIYGYQVGHWPPPLVILLSFLAGVAWITAFALMALLFLWFPNGDYLSRRWRITGQITTAALVLGIASAIVRPGSLPMGAPLENPFGIASLGVFPDYLLNMSALAIFGMILLGVLSILIRYQKSTGVARQQIKWIFYGTFVFGIFLVSDFFIELPGLWESVKESLASAFLPLTVGIAILRYRLYDIDVIIRRTLQYALLTGLLALTYFGGIVILQGILSPLTGSSNSPIVTVITTLGIAALFTPLRNRVQAFIDRRFFRKKYNAEQTLANFAAIARDEVDMEKLAAALLGVVDETMQPEKVSLWISK
jgi:hypothetical protein